MSELIGALIEALLKTTLRLLVLALKLTKLALREVSS